MELKIDSSNNNKIYCDIKLRSQLKQYYLKLQKLLSKKPKNPSNKSEIYQFKRQIIELIKDTFNDKYNIFISGKEVDLQLFIEYLVQILYQKLSKLVEGYNSIFENLEGEQILLLTKSKSTIISFLISFYDFYEDELIINNEEIVSEIINKKNSIEDSFLIATIKTINCLNIPLISKFEFTNLFNYEKKNQNNFFNSKDLGLKILKIIDLFFKIRILIANLNKKKNEGKNVNNQFNNFFSICFDKIVPAYVEFFANVILEYDFKNSVELFITTNHLNLVLTNLSHIKSVRVKILNILCNLKNLFNKDKIAFIKNDITKTNYILKNLFYINRDISNNKYTYFSEFLSELKKVIRYYLVYYSSVEEIQNKILNLILLGITKAKNIKDFKINETIILFFKDINDIGKYEPDSKYKIYHFFIFIFQSSDILRNYIYKILLDNFNGDLDSYQDMLGHTQFLSLFVGNLCKCQSEIIDYFFGFLHSLDKFKYFPALELTNVIYSLICFTDYKSIKILMNNLDIYNEGLIKEINNHSIDSFEKRDLLEEMNKSFLDIFSNIINDIFKSYKENKNEQKNLFTAEMIIPLIEYINKIVNNDIKIYQYYEDKKLKNNIDNFINFDNYKIVVYKFVELFLKTNKDTNKERIKFLINRIDIVLKSQIEEIQRIKELNIIINCLNVIFSYDVMPNLEEDWGKNLEGEILARFNQCLEYFGTKSKNIISKFDNGVHNLIKKIIDNILELFLISNQNCIEKKNLNAPVLTKEHFRTLIYHIILLYSLIEQKNYLSDIFIFLINKSLNIKQIKNIQIKEYKDIYEYYIKLYSIEEDKIVNNSNLYSNLVISNPVLFITLLDTANTVNIKLDEFLKLLFLLCKGNKGNISLLLRHKLMQELLIISSKNSKNNKILYNLFELFLPLARKEDLVSIFEHLIKSYNCNQLNFTNELIKCFIESFQRLCFNPKEYGKGILLSNYEIEQPNIYNIINIKNIKFPSNLNETIIYIKEEILFYDDLTSKNKIILFRMDKFSNNKNQFIEISIINGNLTASENCTNEKLDEDLQINAKNFINMNELNTFIFKFNNTEKILSVLINRKHIFSYPYHFTFSQSLLRTKVISEITSIIRHNIPSSNNMDILITIGYPLESTQIFKENKFCSVPYIKILSFSIYEEKYQGDKVIATNNNYDLNISEISLEAINDNNTYTNLTKFKLDDNTILISKYNIYKYALLNNIYHRYNVKEQLYKYIIFIDKYLSHSLDYNFRIEKYIFILLNNNNIDKNIFKLLLELLTNYVINNNEKMSSFLEKEELSSTLYFILLKHAKYINSELVDILFSCFLSQKNVKNNFITNVFLDYQLFNELDFESQKKSLQLIISKKLIKGKKDFIKLLFTKLYILFILCDFESQKEDNNNIDELIINILLGILSQNINENDLLKSMEGLITN